MSYQITNDLLTGNTTIDNEHRQLFDAINVLLDACAQGHGRDQLAQTMTFLESYIAKHFAHEEQLQAQTKYPDAVHHKQLHDGYKRTVNEICEELKRTGPTITLVGKVNSNVGGWLVSHIKREDVKVAAHIKGSK